MPGYESLTQPLWLGPSRAGKAVGDLIMDPRGDPNKQWFPNQRAMLAGAAEGAGDLVSSFTSPINLAATALTGGAGSAARAGLPAIASGLRTGARIAALPVAYEGAKNVAGPNRTLPERAMGVTQVAAGLAGMRGTPKPKVTTRPSRTIPQRPSEMGRILEQLRAQSANEPHAAKVQRAGDLLHESMGKSGKAPRNPWDELFNDETGSIGDRPPRIADPEKIAIIEDLGPKWIGYADDGGDLFNFARQIRSGETGELGWSHGPLTPDEEIRLVKEGYRLVKRSEMK